MSFAKMTGAVNKVSSTLKYGAKQFSRAGGEAMSAYKIGKGSGFSAAGRNVKAGVGAGVGAGAYAAGASMMRSASKGGARGAAGMAAVGGAGVAGTMAAADFANPWGLGWGD